MVVDKDVDSTFKHVFGNDAFYELVTTKNCGEVSNYSSSPWAENENGLKERHMHYEFSKTIAFSKLNLSVDQTQTQCEWSTPGVVYGVDQWSRTTGVMYSDYMHLDIHVRLEKLNQQTKITVMCHVVWDKSTIMKSRIEKETYNGTKEFYEHFEKELMSEQSSTGNEFDVCKIPKINIRSFKDKVTGGITNGEIQSNGTLRSQEGYSKKSSILSFDERTVFVAFVMIIVTLLIITFALIKLAASIASLSERLVNLEDIISECSNQCTFDN